MSALDIMKLAIAILILIVFIGAVMYLKSSGITLFSSYSKHINTSYTKISESDKTKYDNIIVTGADVINAIRGFEDLQIKVVTFFKDDSQVDEWSSSYCINNPDGDGTMINGVDYYRTYGIVAPDEFNYINPYAKFMGKLIRNANDAITGIEFAQVEYVDSALAQSTLDITTSSGGASTGGSSSGGTNNEVLNALTAAVEQMSSTNTLLSQMITDSDTSLGGGVSQTYIDSALAELATSQEVDDAIAQVMLLLEPLEENLKNDILGTVTDKNGNESLGPTLAALSDALGVLEDSMNSVIDDADSSEGASKPTDSTLDDDNTTTLSVLTDMSKLMEEISTTSTTIMQYLSGGYLDADGTDISISNRISKLMSDLTTIQTTATNNGKKLDTISGKLDDITDRLDSIDQRLENIESNTGGDTGGVTTP